MGFNPGQPHLNFSGMPFSRAAIVARASAMEHWRSIKGNRSKAIGRNYLVFGLESGP
jgi:hypothetical protein